MRDHASSTTAGLVSVFLVLIQASAFAQPRILLTPGERRVYNNCLAQDWIAQYCRANAWGVLATFNRTYAACVAAQHHGRFVLNGRPPFVNMEGYCSAKARGYVR
jgi:nitroimidazol reductase NimA-like FMN-containing flavoprotein (pyridoxamine 5'-phosphate oxidase superfamily)